MTSAVSSKHWASIASKSFLRSTTNEEDARVDLRNDRGFCRDCCCAVQRYARSAQSDRLPGDRCGRDSALPAASIFRIDQHRRQAACVVLQERKSKPRAVIYCTFRTSTIL